MAEIYLVDGSAVAYRSFYAIPKLSTSIGELTNATYGFINTIFKLLKERKPTYLLVTFDLKGPTFRHKVFKEYKEHRKPMPDELSAQIPTIKEILKLLGIKVLELENYEADDIIATISDKLSKQGHTIYILTSDKDAYQLLSENIFLINPKDGKIIDMEWFKENFGLLPEKMVDIIALAGDQVDNIPGVFGIGEKTALELLQKFGSLENLYENIEKISSYKIQKKLLDEKEKAFLSKNLAKLEKNLPLNLTIKEMEIKEPKVQELFQFFERLEFKKLITQFHTIFPGRYEILSIEENIGFSTKEVYSFKEIKENPEKFKKLLENPEVEKYGFNLKEKAVFLFWQGITMRNISFDIAIAKYLTGYVFKKDNIFEIVEEYKKVLKKNEQEYLFYDVEIPLIEVLVWMETNGISIDTPYLKQLSEKFKNQLDVFQNQIYGLAGEVFNINSTQQLSHILFEKIGLPMKKKTKKGYSTDTTVLEELSKIHPLPKLLLDYRELFKLKSAYVDGLIPYINEKTGKIHPSFNQIVTATGRLSCSNPNLQNIPIRTEKGSLIRKAFCPSEGNVFYSFDYSQIELRILAHFSEDTNLINAFLEDKDIHQETAEILFGSNSLFSPSLVFNPSSLTGEDGNESEISSQHTRRLAKIINFGIIYGMSPFGLSKELNISIEEAKKFIDDYFGKFPGVKKYIETITKTAQENGYVSTILGRRRYIPEINSKDKNQQEFGKRIAINMPIQGSSSDLIKVAMNQIYKNFKREGLKSKLVLQIHDELLFDVIPEEGEKICYMVKEIMEKALKFKVPLKVEIKKGKNYLEMEKI